MNITEVHVRMHWKGKLRAFVSITIDGWLVVRGLKVIEKATGDLFVAMPSKEETGKDICHPVHQAGRAYLTEKVLERFHEVAGLSGSGMDQVGRLASSERVSA